MIESIVAFYKLNDNAASTVVVDEKGTNGIAQANTSTKTAAGRVGGALTFNGTSDYVNTNQTFQSTFQNSFSVNLWVKLADGNPAALGRFFAVDAGPDNYYIRLSLTTVGRLDSDYTIDGIANAGTFLNSVFTNGAQSWAMLTMTVKQVSANTVQIILYKDGVAIKTGTATSGITMSDYAGVLNVYFGARNNAGVADGFLAGDYDNVMIFNKALTAAEIALLYNSGRGTEDFSMYPELSVTGSALFSQVGI